MSASAHPRMHAADRRAQLLEVALNLFAEKGFDRTTTKEIAAAAGVTEAIVFRHFPSKQALYEAVLQRDTDSPKFRDWMAQIRGCMDRNDDEGLFRAIAEILLEPYRSDPRMQRVMLFAALEGQQTALEHSRTVSMPIYQLLSEYLLRRQREGALVAIHPGAILSAIAGMAKHFAYTTRLLGFRSDLSDEEAARLFTRILMDGITPRVTQ